MWRNQYPHAFLMRMQTITAILETVWQSHKSIKRHVMVWPSNSTTGFEPKRSENIRPHRNLCGKCPQQLTKGNHPNVHQSADEIKRGPHTQLNITEAWKGMRPCYTHYHLYTTMRPVLNERSQSEKTTRVRLYTSEMTGNAHLRGLKWVSAYKGRGLSVGARCQWMWGLGVWRDESVPKLACGGFTKTSELNTKWVNCMVGESHLNRAA